MEKWVGSLSPVNLDAGAALAQPQGLGGVSSAVWAAVSSHPVVLTVFPASSREPEGLGLLSGKLRCAQRPVFPSGAHFLNSELPGILLDRHQILNLKLMLKVSKLGFHQEQRSTVLLLPSQDPETGRALRSFNHAPDFLCVTVSWTVQMADWSLREHSSPSPAMLLHNGITSPLNIKRLISREPDPGNHRMCLSSVVQTGSLTFSHYPRNRTFSGMRVCEGRVWVPSLSGRRVVSQRANIACCNGIWLTQHRLIRTGTEIRGGNEGATHSFLAARRGSSPALRRSRISHGRASQDMQMSLILSLFVHSYVLLTQTKLSRSPEQTVSPRRHPGMGLFILSHPQYLELERLKC